MDIEEAVPRDPANSRRRSHADEVVKSAAPSKKEETKTVPPAPTSMNLPFRAVEEAPRSRGLPLTTISLLSKSITHEPKLIHPILLKVPMHVRFGFNGLLSNVLFMVVYNFSVSAIDSVAAPTIYSVIYFIFIPLGHAMASLLVFGWPERYMASLMSNVPIGLTALAIGGLLTAYLDQIHFNEMVENFIRDNFIFTKMPPRPGDQKSELYSSMLVLVVTSLWTYILSVYINSPPDTSDKKQL